MILITGCVFLQKESAVKYYKSPAFNPKRHNDLAILMDPNQNFNTRPIEDVFIKWMINKGYTISSRSDMEQIMKEMKFQHSNLTDDNATEVGKMLNVSAVLIVSLSNFYQEGDYRRMNLGVRMINVEKGNIIWSGSNQDSGTSILLGTKISEKIAREIPTIKNVHDIEPNNSIKSISSPLFNQKKIDKIALLVNQKRDMPTRAVEDEFLRLLMKKGYTIPSRSDVEIIMKELEFQYSGLTDDNAVSVGRMLNVPAVLIVDINLYRRERREKGYRIYSMLDARLIDVKKNEILWLGTEFGSKYNDEGTLIVDLSEKLANQFPNRFSKNSDSLVVLEDNSTNILKSLRSFFEL